ncbi:MAG: alanine racemase, partial [Clostridiaceae bacterium]|nr:alanine racemase [Clostridiaceae bacterium]
MNVSNFQKQRTWCELSEAALKNNVYRISQFIPENIRKIAVVKADGYGHGATWIAKIALKNGFTDLAVATLEEAINLREASINVPILLLSPFQPGTAKYLIEFDITQTISSEYEA